MSKKQKIVSAVLKEEFNTVCSLKRNWYSDIRSLSFQTMYDKSDAVIKITTDKLSNSKFIITAELLKNVNNEHLLGVNKPEIVETLEVIPDSSGGVYISNANFEDYGIKVSPFFKNYCFFPDSKNKDRISTSHLNYYLKRMFEPYTHNEAEYYVCLLDLNLYKSNYPVVSSMDLIKNMPTK